MYLRFFGFSSTPFSLSPDTEHYVSLDGHKQCWDTLVYALSTGEGFVKIIGEVGTGKTIMCRKLLRFLHNKEEAGADYVSLYIPNPLLSPTGLFRALAAELNLSPGEHVNTTIILEQINREMLNLAKEKKSLVIIIDEAQALPAETLEALRLITNLETEKHKLVQVVLFAQNELNNLLNQYEFRQLRQRITFSCLMEPLSLSSTSHYLKHRLFQAGYSGEQLFSPGAIRLVYRYSRGIPRLINILSQKALLAAFARQSHKVGRQDVQAAWSDQSDSTLATDRRPIWTISILLLCILALAGVQAGLIL